MILFDVDFNTYFVAEPACLIMTMGSYFAKTPEVVVYGNSGANKTILKEKMGTVANNLFQSNMSKLKY